MEGCWVGMESGGRGHLVRIWSHWQKEISPTGDWCLLLEYFMQTVLSAAFLRAGKLIQSPGCKNRGDTLNCMARRVLIRLPLCFNSNDIYTWIFVLGLPRNLGIRIIFFLCFNLRLTQLWNNLTQSRKRDTFQFELTKIFKIEFDLNEMRLTWKNTW